MNLKNILNPVMGTFITVLVLGLCLPLITSYAAQTEQSHIATQSNQSTPTVTIAPTPTPLSQPAAQAKPAVKKTTPVAPKTSACIVTINGSRYDVTALRKTHSGGDIFVCGSDMTATFKKQHGTNWGLIAKFRV